MKMKKLITCLLLLLVAGAAQATIVSLTQGQINSPTVVNLDGIPDGTEVNGLLTGGVSFSVTSGGLVTNGLVVVDGGPGITSNISPPNFVSFVSPAGIVFSITFPAFETQFGYGFALLAHENVSDATTISLFSGNTFLGSLAYPATPDPDFAGGFAGIGSTTPFDHALMTFSSAGAAFAVDNIRFSQAAIFPQRVPENGSTAFLLGAVAFLLGACSASRRDIEAS